MFSRLSSRKDRMFHSCPPTHGHANRVCLLPSTPLPFCLASVASRPWRRGGFYLYYFRVRVWSGGAQVVVARVVPSHKVSPASSLSRRRCREACGSGVVFNSFFQLWGCSDGQGASSVVHPSSSYLGLMRYSWPVQQLPVHNQQCQASPGRFGNGGTLSTRTMWRLKMKGS
jgi:hypothetical protein